MLGILTFAASLISPSGWANKFPGDALSAKTSSSFLLRNQVPGEYLLRASQQSPGLADHLLPTGNLDDATIPSDQIVAELASYVEALATIIQDVAVSFTSNLIEFTQWLSSGYFVNEPPAMDTMETSIIQALNTYVLSQVPQANNILVARQVDTDPYQLQTNATGKENITGIDLGCSHGYDNNSICGQWWHDTRNNVAFPQFHLPHVGQQHPQPRNSLQPRPHHLASSLFLGSQVPLAPTPRKETGPNKHLIAARRFRRLV